MNAKAFMIVCIFLITSSFLFSIGFRAGLNLSDFASSEISNNSVKYGLNVGVFGVNRLANNFIFQPEIIFSQKGCTFDFGDVFDEYSYEEDFNLNYIEIPLLLKKEFSANKDVSIQLYGGPSIAFLTSANINTSFGSDSEDHDATKYFNTTDISLNVGVDLYFNEKIMAGIRYNRGVTDISKGQNNDDDDDYNDKSISTGRKSLNNSNIMLLFGFTL